MKRPFDIVFEKFDDHIVIYAVAHTKRKPGYWRERLNDAMRQDRGRNSFSHRHEKPDDRDSHKTIPIAATPQRLDTNMPFAPSLNVPANRCLKQIGVLVS